MSKTGDGSSVGEEAKVVDEGDNCGSAAKVVTRRTSYRGNELLK